MGKLKAAVGECTIRMYRHGLGDCFLLAFGATRQTTKYILIDCGVLLSTKGADQMMKEVVEDICQATGNHLDVLAITHEHWDHVSGFIQAEKYFSKMTVDQVWFAWTEDPNNPLARELRQRRRAALNGIRFALQKASSEPSMFTRRIASLNAFFGPQQDLGLAGRAKTEDALDFVKQSWKKHQYCYPGGLPLEIHGLPGVRFYVLGPPADLSYIRKSRPSSREGQVYLDDSRIGRLGYYLAMLSAAPAVRNEYSAKKIFAPFDEAYNLDASEKSVSEIAALYNQETWRQIEADWTGAAGKLALQLDTHTNNTSLVLAIEIGPEDKVLLFPGDAQVGNWLSWDSVKWNRGYKDMTAQDLLSRTVLYKVGHHGSHNATLREKGLERMTNAELSAFIPVSCEMAERMCWRMPHKPLLERLKEKTLGRVVLSDEGLQASAIDSTMGAFKRQCFENRLYFDYTITKWNTKSSRGRKMIATKAVVE